MIQYGMKRKTKSVHDELHPEYDFDNSKGVRGKYFESYKKGTNLVLLSPDVAKAFPTEEAVNEALRSLLNLAQKSIGQRRRSTGRTRKLRTD